MFDRFTERARKVMSYARQEAERLNHDYIGTEHILLGLTRDPESYAAVVLRDFGIEFDEVRAEMDKIVQRGEPIKTFGQLPFTPCAKGLLEEAINEAKRMKHNYLGTEHLLVGTILVEEGLAAQVLLNLGLKADLLRSQVAQRSGSKRVTNDLLRSPLPLTLPIPVMPTFMTKVRKFLSGKIDKDMLKRISGNETYGIFDRFTDRARDVCSLAHQIALAHGHDFIGTEHLLIGICKEGVGGAAHVLGNLGINLDQLISDVEKLLFPANKSLEHQQLPFTPRAKVVFELAVDEARMLNHNYVATEHLLLGLLRERDGLAAQALNRFGINYENTRIEILKFLNTPTRKDGSRSALDELPLFTSFTDRADTVMRLAIEAARRLNQMRVGTEHILLGLSLEGMGVAANVLENLGAERERLKPVVAELSSKNKIDVLPVALPLTPGAEKAVEMAYQEAKNLGHLYVGTEHLLLSLLHNREEGAAKALEACGITLEEVRKELLDFLSTEGEKPDP